MTNNAKSEAIKKCDQLIEAVSKFIDDENPRKALEELLKIERENKSLIQSSPYLIAGLNSYLGLAYFDLDKASGNR